MIVVDIPVTQRVKVHKCPNCGHEHWRSTESQHLFCDSPERVCPICGTHFIDKNLYCEWDNMTKAQKRYYIHWHGEPHRIFLVVFMVFTFMMSIALIASFFGSREIIMIILGSIALIGSGVLGYFAFNKYHLIKNCARDPDVKASILATRGFVPEDNVKIKNKKKEKKDSKVVDFPNTRLKSNVPVLKRKIDKKIELLKNKKLSQEQFSLIQEIFLTYNDKFLEEFDFKAASLNDELELFNYISGVINQMEHYLQELNKI